MKKKIKTFALAVFGLLTLAALCSVAVSGQKTNPKDDIPKGYSLIDGDILMPTWFVNAVLRGNAPEATYRTNLWAVGLVRFEFDANVTTANQTNMINAMAVLENVANVDFVQCANNNCSASGASNFVHVQNSTGNNSQVGMVGGQQIINIVSWNSQFTIVHELLHCLGFFHEHTRPDRNSYVQINCSPAPQTCNIQGGFGGTIYNNNFVIPSDTNRYGIYDYDSLMHYDDCAFSIDCPAGATCNCTNKVFNVLGTVPPGITIGQRTHLSALDQAMVSFLYPKSDWRLVDCNYDGSNGAPSGSFFRPYTTLNAALANTPAGGTIWILNFCSFPGGTFSNNVTIGVAPYFFALIQN